MTDPTSATPAVTLYTTTWCPFCTRLVDALDRTGTPYARIDVEEDAEAASWVESVNNGNRVVPTVKYADGSYATNPPAGQVRRRVSELTGS
ncbi:mycoredoxin [Corynebacterium terpenotabidum]|uniref:Glutaredoxin domain-containing protein n=1 Tax=Corynebacterium terpenotabidum Y-11 TaxID=1200352 RepID=S4XF39_9CORY|nr:mycoredoxin [Corynebacterium terpenotabidum]AGP30230.1 hypothetical protein A606_02885 [Corynebacterium terpenotabidum Y-11]